MSLFEVSELYNLISNGSENIQIRKRARRLRKNTLERASWDQGFTKVAFDTRRIDQETQYNPRRGLQNYNRSEAFISEALSQKIKNFARLRQVLLGLKEVYGKEHQWQDSNARVLLSTLDNGLRTVAQDGDFAVNQPGTGSFDYIEELLHVRYRLGFDQLTALGEADLKKIILSKDEELIHRDTSQDFVITKSDISSKGYDTLLEKLFTVSAPSGDDPIVERSITITIRDSLPSKVLNKQG